MDERIREIPIPQDVLEQTAAQAMSNPPRFPLLEGQEKFWIIRQITLLTKQGKIHWKHDFRYSEIITYASYLGLIVCVNRKFNRPWTDPSGLLFNVYDEYQKKQSYLVTVSFDGIWQSDIDEFIAAVQASIRKGYVHEDKPLNFIWEILNLR